jgi:hypothetical protein
MKQRRARLLLEVPLETQSQIASIAPIIHGGRVEFPNFE